MKQVRESKAAQSLSVYVIAKGKRHVATVQAHRSESRCQVDVWHEDSTPLQQGSASGYGYDKLTTALSGLKIDGHTLSDHCAERIKPPSALGYFPVGYKPRKGYSLANYGEYDNDGKRWYAYEWRDRARLELGPDADWQAVDSLAKALKDATALTPGYSDCYKDAGLEYLRALGYTVIRGI